MKYRRHENIVMLVGYFEQFVDGEFSGKKYVQECRITKESEEYKTYQIEQLDRVEDICRVFRVDRKRPLRQEEIDSLITRWALRKLSQ